MYAPSTLSGVVTATVVTSVAAVVAAVGLSWLVIPAERMPEGAISTLIISPIIALPISFLVWSKMREIQVLTKRLRFMVDHDHLTKLASREYLFRQMAKEPKSEGVSLMVDIDHFKKVNDTYGHAVGDQVIKAVADILMKNTRAEDIVCRFGGEEFTVFLSCRSRSEAQVIAKRMQETVEQTIIPTDAGGVTITISVGCAEKAADLAISEAIKAADAALYEAKNSGRNQVVMSDLKLVA